MSGRSNTFWFDRTASTLSTSATNTVESPATATPALGCAAVENDAGLRHNISFQLIHALDSRSGLVTYV